MENKCEIDTREIERLVARRIISRGKVFIRRGQVVRAVERLLGNCGGVSPEDALVAAEQRGLKLYDLDYLVYGGSRTNGDKMLLIPASLESRLPPNLFNRLLEDVIETVELYHDVEEELLECEGCEDALPDLGRLVVKKLYVWLRGENEHSWDDYGLSWYYGVLALDYGLGDEVVQRDGVEYRRVGDAWIAISRHNGEYRFRYYTAKPMELW